jgi:hypothetical protein
VGDNAYREHRAHVCPAMPAAIVAAGIWSHAGAVSL